MIIKQNNERDRKLKYFWVNTQMSLPKCLFESSHLFQPPKHNDHGNETLGFHRHATEHRILHNQQKFLRPQLRLENRTFSNTCVPFLL